MFNNNYKPVSTTRQAKKLLEVKSIATIQTKKQKDMASKLD